MAEMILRLCIEVRIQESEVRSQEPGEGLLRHVRPSAPSSAWNRPLTRPAPAGESAGSGTPSPQGRGQRPNSLAPAFCLLSSAFCFLSSAYCSLPTAYCLLPSALRLLRRHSQ